MKTISKFTVEHTIDNYGATAKVKKGLDVDTGDEVAIKLMHYNLTKSLKESFFTEINTLKTLSHPNVIKLVDHGSADYKGKQTDFIALELALTDFSEILRIDGALKERYARYYFKQLLQGLQHCHENGIANRDIKSQNLLMDKNFNLKISDFGFAHSTNETCSQYLGTEGFMAPEIVARNNYSAADADLFAAAVVLFTWVANHRPFKQADKDDSYYKCIQKKRPDIFWKSHLKKLTSARKAAFSEELQNLLTQMFQKNPSKRLSLGDLMAHEWMQGPIASESEVELEIEQRIWLLNQEKEQEKREKRAKKQEKEALRKLQLSTTAENYVSDSTADVTGDDSSKETIDSIEEDSFEQIVTYEEKAVEATSKIQSNEVQTTSQSSAAQYMVALSLFLIIFAAMKLRI